MNVFISWSGERSKAIAEVLRTWVKAALQATKPWMSGKDLDRGSLWFSEIADQLKDSSVGIICLTQDNKDKPWILFEAGALAKGLSSNRVMTVLIDLEPQDIQDPLAQFNHTKLDKNGMRQLLGSLNKALGAQMLESQILDSVFDAYWPGLEAQITAALAANKPAEKAKPRNNESILVEILESTRSMNSRIQKLESNRTLEVQKEAALRDLQEQIDTVKRQRMAAEAVARAGKKSDTLDQIDLHKIAELVRQKAPKEV